MTNKKPIKFYSYYGGKNAPKIQRKIQALIPPHNISIEPYAGSAGITLNKERSEVEILSDGDRDISHLLATMADKEKGLLLKERLKQLEISRYDFENARKAKIYNYCGMDDVERAVCIFTVICFSFNAARKNYRAVDKEDYQRIVRRNIDLVYKRLQGVQVKCMDAVELINMHKEDASVFMAIDPPYVSWLRTTKEVYSIEAPFSAQHRLLTALTTGDIKANIMLFGYRSPKDSIDLYDYMLLKNGWTRYTLSEVSKSSAKVKEGESKPKGIEFIWLSPNYPLNENVGDYISLDSKRNWEDLFNE